MKNEWEGGKKEGKQGGKSWKDLERNGLMLSARIYHSFTDIID